MRLIGSAAWPDSGGFALPAAPLPGWALSRPSFWYRSPPCATTGGEDMASAVRHISLLCSISTSPVFAQRRSVSLTLFTCSGRGSSRQTGSARLRPPGASALSSPGRRGERHCTHTAPDTFPRSLPVSGGCRNHSSQHHDSHRCLLLGPVCLLFQIRQRSSVGAIH